MLPKNNPPFPWVGDGNFMSAQEAMSLGFVSRVVERDMLMDTALEFARNMNHKNPAGLRLTKEAININMHISWPGAGPR